MPSLLTLNVSNPPKRRAEALLHWLWPRSEDRYVLPEETAAYHALSERHGLLDAFRLHQPDGDVASWVDHSGVGCRYDHAFVTPDLECWAPSWNMDPGWKVSRTTRP